MASTEAANRPGFRATITGMGCISAAGTDVESHWRSLQQGRVNCGPVPAWLFPTELPYPVFAAPQDPLTKVGRSLLGTAAPGIHPQSLSRTAMLCISALAEALQNADIEPHSLRGKKTGIVLGTTVACAFNNDPYYKAWRQDMQTRPAAVLDYVTGNLAALLHRLLGTSGPAAVVTNACASGTDAVGLAREWLAAGQCDIAIAGGGDTLDRKAYNGFVSLQLTDSGPCRPFDRTRQGLTLGEGAGIVIMEDRKTAQERHATPLGWVRGYGSASDAWHPTAPHPEARGLIRAYQQAMAESGGDRQPALINAHGTGTRANDAAETNGLATMLPDRKHAMVVSTKGITGHTLGAAGGIEAVLTLRALRQGMTPGTTGCLEPDPALAVSPLPQGESLHLGGRIGISQSLAFGGGNAALVLEAAP